MLRLHYLFIALLLAAIGVGNALSSRSAATRTALLMPTTAAQLRSIADKPFDLATTTATATPLPQATATADNAAAHARAESQPIPPQVVITLAQPVRLVIPKLGVDALVESVGQDENGAMAIPSKVEQVAWYAPGAAPGEIGNAVLAGHLDRADGSPAVFWDIGKLQVSDTVIVYDAANVAYHFQVTGNQRYAYSAAPLEEIFGFALRSQLNLITCAGTWDSASSNYSNRLVVYTSLVKTVRP